MCVNSGRVTRRCGCSARCANCGLQAPTLTRGSIAVGLVIEGRGNVDLGEHAEAVRSAVVPLRPRAGLPGGPHLDRENPEPVEHRQRAEPTQQADVERAEPESHVQLLEQLGR